MAEQTTAVQEAPAAPEQTATTQTQEAPVAPTSEQTPASKEAITNLEDVTDWSTLEKILEQAEQPEHQEVESKTEQPKPPATNEQSPVVPPAKPPVTNSEEEDTETEPPKNFRFHSEDPTERRFLRLLRQNPGANPIELARLAGYKGEATAAAPNPAQVEETQPTPQADPLKPFTDKVAELKQKLKEAEASYSPTAEILDELQDAKLALRDAKEGFEMQTAAQADFARDYKAHRAEALKLCPESGQPGTPQAEEVRREILFLESTEPELFQNPDYPVKVLERVAKRRPELFKLAPKAAPTTQTTPPPAGAARLATGAVESPSGVSAPTTFTPDAAAKKIDELSLEELEQLSNDTGEKAGRR